MFTKEVAKSRTKPNSEEHVPLFIVCLYPNNRHKPDKCLPNPSLNIPLFWEKLVVFIIGSVISMMAGVPPSMDLFPDILKLGRVRIEPVNE